MFTAALFIIVKLWRQPKYPLTDTWIKKMFYLGKIKSYLALKPRKFYVQFATPWRNLEDIKLDKSVIESQSCVTPLT